MTGKAPKLSAFGRMVEEAFRDRDVLVGQPAKRRELIAQVEDQGMSVPEFRLVMRWWDRQTGFTTYGPLTSTLLSEESWRDVVESEGPRRDREESEAAARAHYPGMPQRSYDTNPLSRDLRLSAPYDARAVLAGWLWGVRPANVLASRAGWETADVDRLIDAAELRDWKRRVHITDAEGPARIDAALAKVRDAAPELLEVRGA